MSRPQKIHKPINGAFNNILAAVAQGTGKGRAAAKKLAAAKAAQTTVPPKSGTEIK